MKKSALTSQISSFYKGKSVFITGATGFVGKCLIEKLLRSCTDLNKIYVLIRPKKGHDTNKRLRELLSYKLFESVKAMNPNVQEKLVGINGDMLQSNLGISKDDEERLCRDVNVVFHSAATVKFNEPLKLAADINVTGLKKMIDIAKKMRKLEVFTHVSTAYSQCLRHEIDETVYEPPMKPSILMSLCEQLDEEQVNYLEPKIIKKVPNTYTFTKAVAEALMMEYEKEIPSVIVRPSAIGATWREPFPGWIDNYAAVTGLMSSAEKGLLSSMLGDRNAISDFIPADISVNMMIAAAWYKGTKQTEKTLVFNNTSGSINPIRFAEFLDYCNMRLGKSFFEKLVLPSFNMTRSKLVKYSQLIIEQIIPALIKDFYLKINNKRPRHIRMQKSILNHASKLEHFTVREWKFGNDNVNMLKSALNEVDAQKFNFDIKDLDWPSYFYDYSLGIKEHLFKEDISKLKLKNPWCEKKDNFEITHHNNLP